MYTKLTNQFNHTNLGESEQKSARILFDFVRHNSTICVLEMIIQSGGIGVVRKGRKIEWLRRRRCRYDDMELIWYLRRLAPNSQRRKGRDVVDPIFIATLSIGAYRNDAVLI